MGTVITSAVSSKVYHCYCGASSLQALVCKRHFFGGSGEEEVGDWHCADWLYPEEPCMKLRTTHRPALTRSYPPLNATVDEPKA